MCLGLPTGPRPSGVSPWGANPNPDDKIRPPDNPAVPPTPEPPVPPELPVTPTGRERDNIGRPLPSPAQTVSFVAPAPPTAADLSAGAASRVAPQSLGGLAARFTTPTGKQGYSKSLRPEYGRLVR